MTIESILQARSDEIYSCTADMSVSQAVEILAEKRIGALPVLDGDHVAGIFSERDVLHCVRRYGHEAMAKHVRD
ncbi:MAG: CBS domain-containing protein, partial [Parasphingorhabdus sp.]